MKQLLIITFACLMFLFNLGIANPVHAQSLITASSLVAKVTEAKPPENLLEELKAQLLPQLESILTPEQQSQLESAVAEGKTSLRKAFKSIMLTPDQKNKIATVFKSLPQKDLFASMTPEQKKQLFVKKKEFFMPTSEEISQRINAGMKNKKYADMKDKKPFIPTPEEISQKISAGMKMLKNKLDD